MQHGRNRKLRTLAVALVAAALAAPATQAAVDIQARHQALGNLNQPAQVDAHHQALLRHHEQGGLVYVTNPPRTAASDGMDWGDAGIGAGAALGVILLGAGVALTGRRRLSHA